MTHCQLCVTSQLVQMKHQVKPVNNPTAAAGDADAVLKLVQDEVLQNQ